MWMTWHFWVYANDLEAKYRHFISALVSRGLLNKRFGVSTINNLELCVSWKELGTNVRLNYNNGVCVWQKLALCFQSDNICRDYVFCFASPSSSSM
jgi:hypothetical protein